MQKGVVFALTGTATPENVSYLPLPEGATALWNLLASILEPLPECETPQGSRKVAEGIAKDLALLIRGMRAAKALPSGDSRH